MFSRARIRLSVSAVLMLTALIAVPPAHGGATLTIVNMDRPNEGFNDPTPAEPVGGNPGTTVGTQRLIAFQYAANIWGAKLDSTVPVRVQANFDPLPCGPTSGVLGAAGTIFIVRDFPGALLPGIWYHSALANKLAGEDLIPGRPGSSSDDIGATFNSLLGSPGCLETSAWYYGLDNNAPPGRIDLVAVVLHEFAHGLGFANFVNEANGASPEDRGDIYSQYTYDITTGKIWNQMTPAERQASAINVRKVVWNGMNVTTAAPSVLQPGTPVLIVNTPAGIAGDYPVGLAAFGPPLASPGVTANVALGLDGSGAPGDACEPLVNAAEIAGKIALVDRGACTFTTKVKNAQDAGAVAVLIADNVPGSPPPGLGGTDMTITIPAARITQADGNTIRMQLAMGPVNVTLGVDLTLRAGLERSTGQALLYTPDPVALGSSVSHWDTSAIPNQLMEPAINADLTHNVDPPNDLSLPLMLDIGWTTGAPDECPTSDENPTIAIESCQTEVPNLLFSNGCTFADFVAKCAADGRNHGGFASCVSALTNVLKSESIITGEQKSQVESCAARSSLP